ncbi:MAG: hypothetical protein IPH10_10760 [bacterium]|nr:hypothetical protein [bacterium]
MPEGIRNSRSEFGIEIIFDSGVCITDRRFAGQCLPDHELLYRLELSKSWANSLLNQLADDWNQQYDTIAELIALQMIVYIDETG